MPVEVKICGVTTVEAIHAAAEHGVRHLGLVFYRRSPRYLSLEAATRLAVCVPPHITKVGLFVDPDDILLERSLTSVPLDMIQLHGDEDPARVAAIRLRWGLPVMKAIKISTAADFTHAGLYLECADRLLFDAKPPASMTGALPGGNALSFDWNLLAGRDWPLPWMLSGGLNAENLARAVRTSGATAVDVSSGVEDRPGHKDPQRIAAFMAAAAGL